MLLQSVSITPHRLGDRAKINWLLARDILRGLVKKGHATALQNVVSVQQGMSAHNRYLVPPTSRRRGHTAPSSVSAGKDGGITRRVRTKTSS